MLVFQYKELLFFLLTIPLLVALFFYVLATKKSTLKKIGDPLLVKHLTANHNASAYLRKFILVIAAFGILVLVLANLRSAAGEEQVSRDGIDVMIALDVSKSMLAQDVKPTRLDRAKQVLSKLVDKLHDDRIGIVIFAGKAYLQMPLTADHSAAKMYLSSASTESVPTQGTVIGDALRTCNASFNAQEKKYKAVVLISDGEDHDETAMKTAQSMAASGVVIYTVGIGSPTGAPIVDETTGELKKDNVGNTVISKLNEASLRSVAEKGNGSYFLFNNTDAIVSALSSQLDSMDQRNVKDDSLVNYKSYFQYFLALAFLLLLIEMFLSERKKVKNDYAKLKPALSLLLMLICSNGFAQDDKLMVKKGNDAYKNKDFNRAAQVYEQALNKNSSNHVARFNLGNALYKTDRKDEAIIAYDLAADRLTAPEEKSNAAYNKGTVLHINKKLQECIAAYKTALKLDPENEDARHNLQRALSQQKKEKKQQEQKQEQQQKKQQNKQEPKPQRSKLTKEDADNKLKALSQQEKNLQDKLHKVKAVSANKPEKDW